MNQKLSSFEAFSMLIMLTINAILLDLPKYALEKTGTGSIANCIFIGFFILIFILFFNKLFKNFPTWDILDISNYLGGKVLKTLVGLLFLFILFISICNSLAQVSVMLKTVYFEKSPMLFILLFFIIGILFCNLKGFGAVKSSICFYLPITLLTLFIVLKSKINGFSLLKITPIFGYDLKTTFISGFSNIFIFTNILMMYFLLPFLENNKNFKKITLWSFIISWIFFIFTFLALLTSYPFDNISADLNSIYILTRRIELTAFIQRSDGIFVFTCILAFLSYLSLTLYLITHIIKKIFNFESEKTISYSVIPLILGLTYLFTINNFYRFDGTSFFQYTFILTVFIISLFILIFSTIKKKKI